MRVIPVIVLSIFLVACDKLDPPQRYQLYGVSSGAVYRLDTKTGAVHLITPEGTYALSEGHVKLKQGSYYQMEDEKLLKYLGGGQFEKSAGGDAILKKYGIK